MSKTSLKNKAAKAKTTDTEPTETILNAGKCCTCRYFPQHIKGVAQPCKQLGAYVARKAEHPCWKAK